MRVRNTFVVIAALMLAACGGHDADYYATHLGEAEERLKTCSRQDIVEDAECGAAAHAVAMARMDKDMAKGSGEEKERRRAASIGNRCELVAQEDHKDCVVKVTGGTDPDALVRELTGVAPKCEEPSDQAVQSIAAGAEPISDCARTFSIALPEAWQWRDTNDDQGVFIAAPGADTESMRTAQISAADTIECSASSGPANKSPQPERNRKAAAMIDYLRDEAAKLDARSAAFSTVTALSAGPAMGVLQREVFIDGGNAQVSLQAVFELPGRRFQMNCSFTTTADNPRFEDSPLTAMMESIAKSFTPINMPTY